MLVTSAIAGAISAPWIFKEQIRAVRRLRGEQLTEPEACELEDHSPDQRVR
jgi:hypothetical protein